MVALARGLAECSSLQQLGIHDDLLDVRGGGVRNDLLDVRGGGSR